MTDSRAAKPGGTTRTKPAKPTAKPVAKTPARKKAANKHGHGNVPKVPDHWDVKEKRGADGKIIEFTCVWKGAPDPQPRGMGELVNRIGRTDSALKMIYGEKRKEQYATDLETLVGLARVGLDKPRPDPAVAGAYLEMLQWDVLRREGPRIKRDQVRILGIWALAFALASIVLYFAFERWPWLPAPEFQPYRNLLLVHAACMAGAWVSFAGRKVTLNFFDLGAVEETSLDPWLRLIFASILTFVLVLTFITGFADIQIGGLKASDIMSSGSLALLIGALCGLSEKALPAVIKQKVETLFADRTSRVET